MEELLDAHTALRLATLSRHGSFVGGPGAHAFLRERIAPLHREGTVAHAEHEGRVVAVLAWRHDPDPFFGVPVSTLRWWHRTLRSELEQSRDGRFLELVTGSPAPAAMEPAVEIVLSRGGRILVRPGFDAEHLRRVMELFES